MASEIQNFKPEREAMLKHLRARDITDEAVLRAFERVPRHRFVPHDYQRLAYADQPLPIESGQTISQPYIVALMTQALQTDGVESVLEIGTGSGYQTAILAELVHTVYTIERFESLAEQAKTVLAELGYNNIHYRAGDGTLGWPEAAPYHRIIVTAAPPEIPQPLIDQLRDGGRMVIPVGERTLQDLVVVTRTGGKIERSKICDCRFVPLVGAAGWHG